MQQNKGRKIYTHIFHMREKNKNRTIIAIVQIDVAKYTINYPFVKDTGWPFLKWQAAIWFKLL